MKYVFVRGKETRARSESWEPCKRQLKTSKPRSGARSPRAKPSASRWELVSLTPSAAAVVQAAAGGHAPARRRRTRCRGLGQPEQMTTGFVAGDPRCRGALPLPPVETRPLCSNGRGSGDVVTHPGGRGPRQRPGLPSLIRGCSIVGVRDRYCRTLLNVLNASLLNPSWLRDYSAVYRMVLRFIIMTVSPTYIGTIKKGKIILQTHS